MKVLVVKMSSMGDVFHLFPALTDAKCAIPDLQFDWVVEEGFAEIPAWHPAVQNVYRIGLRRWRKGWFEPANRHERKTFFSQLKHKHYDLVVDAQGLLKSAWVVRKVEGEKVGFDWHSAREPLVSWFYDRKVAVAKEQHAITRLRQLMAGACGYDLPDMNENHIEYGLDHQAWSKPDFLHTELDDAPYWVGLHGTTWDTKLWPERYWVELIRHQADKGLKVVLPWGNEEEKARAQRLLEKANLVFDQAWVPQERLALTDMARLLKFSEFVVSVDTGLSHVAAALDVPMVVLYRVTDPKLVGALGPNVTRLVSPLGPQYLKQFSPGQAERSLEGLDVDSVLKSLAMMSASSSDSLSQGLKS
ncbi:lipopolysaccharide heptosyltransferase I [Thiomicrospira sp. WB1]|uniref:lipopolysaccharide heptosyltransferase I n=1 Tax=Thiomicrospira sp. WB1 TaxID=1685380 RepID=UPI000746C96F|nr:lipopolysaccharide heptosyltransferase I [Thiomicrospira sp. WB1]KUJ73003.1 ADP-heptose--LPS heptosyltransferase [Thiomicrospira sp. WB1]